MEAGGCPAACSPAPTKTYASALIGAVVPGSDAGPAMSDAAAPLRPQFGMLLLDFNTFSNALFYFSGKAEQEHGGSVSKSLTSRRCGIET